MNANENARTQREAQAAVSSPHYSAHHEIGLARALASLAYAEKRQQEKESGSEHQPDATTQDQAPTE